MPYSPNFTSFKRVVPEEWQDEEDLDDASSIDEVEVLEAKLDECLSKLNELLAMLKPNSTTTQSLPL